jgi:Tfp pilus assembly protein PilZ
MLKQHIGASTLASCVVRSLLPWLVRMNVPDHRRHPRLEFDGRAWCEHQNLTLYLPISNVSAGGIFIQTGAPMTTGQRLKVSFGTLDPGADEVIAKVEIVWTGKGRRGAGVGCRFTSFLSGEEAYNRMIARLEG